MRRCMLIMLLVLCFALPCSAADVRVWTSPEESLSSPIPSKGPLKLRRLRLRDSTWTRAEKKELGLLPRQVVAELIELQRTGELDGLDKTTAAYVVLGKIVEDRPEAYADASIDYEKKASQSLEASRVLGGGDKDWPSFFDALIRFLEALIPLLMMFGSMA